ncbi:type II toxin-antitoxin system RelE/ParE family toxin [Candidatus Micrarchaeota archaeon]|nr:type II toxin-antitoxin system RelE/ParE family toxin [Candidatus Micrarchaeota archaeon]
MTFKLVFSEESLSQLKKLDNPTAKRILDKLDSTSGNPIHFFERLVEREDYKLCVGDYRVIAKIMHKEKIVFILSFGHRKNIYKKA